MNNELIIIGYSGHSYVCIETAISLGYHIYGYCDVIEKENPFNLKYLGQELESLDLIVKYDYFVAIGDNQIRSKITSNVFNAVGKSPVSLLDTRSVISPSSSVNMQGVLIMPNVTINALARIGSGCIINTNSTIEHECEIENFVHIAPGAVLAGHVLIGDYSFVGANSVIKQGVKIGSNVTIGAGSVILNDIPDNTKVVGNPGRIIR